MKTGDNCRPIEWWTKLAERIRLLQIGGEKLPDPIVDGNSLADVTDRINKMGISCDAEEVYETTKLMGWTFTFKEDVNENRPWYAPTLVIVHPKELVTT